MLIKHNIDFCLITASLTFHFEQHFLTAIKYLKLIDNCR